MSSKPLRVAFIHPDLGIGGAERLVVDAAMGLQALGHSLIIYTSHHDPNHCFDETRNGNLEVHHVVPPFPRDINGKFHILFAHLKQLQLTLHLLWPWAPKYDVYFVDQLSTCVPFLRAIARTPVVFYCHFPDKLLANGEFIEGNLQKKRVGLLKRIYRYPMDWLEEVTTRQADVILSNSNFTARVFTSYFPSIRRKPTTVYPGINISAYETPVDASDPDIVAVSSDSPTLLSLNRFEKKKNAALAIESFAKLRRRISELANLRLVLAGGYDPRLEDNMQTLYALIDLARKHSLTFNVITSSSSSVKIPPLNSTPTNPDILFLLNFSTQQRTALLTAASTRALLYTPANEHFGIVPVEAMCCGLPVLACDSGGPTESTIKAPPDERTGWLCDPDADLWADALTEIVRMSPAERAALSQRAKDRARLVFGMQAMASRLDDALQQAVAMGPPSSGVWWLMVIGFMLAYFVAPWVMKMLTKVLIQGSAASKAIVDASHGKNPSAIRTRCSALHLSSWSSARSSSLGSIGFTALAFRIATRSLLTGSMKMAVNMVLVYPIAAPATSMLRTGRAEVRYAHTESARVEMMLELAMWSLKNPNQWPAPRSVSQLTFAMSKANCQRASLSATGSVVFPRAVAGNTPKKPSPIEEKVKYEEVQNPKTSAMCLEDSML